MALPGKLSEQAPLHLKRLQQIEHDVVELGHRLYGPTPQPEMPTLGTIDGATGAVTATPPDHVAGNLAMIGDQLTRIEAWIAQLMGAI